MAQPRIVIVGGVAGGASAATRARRMNEEAEIVIFEKGEHVSFANCGLPYYVGGRIQERSKLLLASPDYFARTFGIQVHVRSEVTRIDRDAKQVDVVDQATGEKRTEHYDKLILSPGASPIVPPWDHVDSNNVFVLRDVPDSDQIKAYIDENRPKKAVVIGGGYIGIEMAEVLTEAKLQVDIVEMYDHVMPLFDAEMANEIEVVLTDNGVSLHTACKVENLLSADSSKGVTSVKLADGRELPADFVVVSIGVKPNVQLARDAGLTIGETGGITTNEYGQTNDPNIYAVGDAAEYVHRVLGKPMRVPLAGPANRNGRLIGQHAATGSAASFTPVSGTAVVGYFGKGAALTGLSLKGAQQAGFDADAAYALRGHHAGYYPGAEPMVLKVIYERGTRKVLGAQAVGGAGIDKRVDVVATTIHFGGTLDDLAGLDLAYAPQFGSAKDPLHIAAFVGQNQEDGFVSSVLPGDGQWPEQLLDVRTDKEFQAGSLPNAIHIPLASLRDRLGELDPSKPIGVFCGVGQRAYNACRILSQHEFEKVYNLAGGYRMYKYQIDQQT